MFTPHRMLPLPLAVFCAACCTVAMADVYKWIDADGSTQYGDTPPAQADPRTVERIELKPSAPPPATVPLVEPGPAASPETAAPLAPDAPPLAKTTARDFEVVCLLRYSLPCAAMEYWKSDLRQECARARNSDCDDPGFYLRQRPGALTALDLDLPFPWAQPALTAADYECLQHSGFYCYELRDEAFCKAHYLQSCAALADWVTRGIAKCEDNHGVDCSNPATVAADRPAAEEEVWRAGKGRHGAVRDLLLEHVIKDWPPSRAALDQLLQRLPGS